MIFFFNFVGFLLWPDILLVPRNHYCWFQGTTPFFSLQNITVAFFSFRLQHFGFVNWSRIFGFPSHRMMISSGEWLLICNWYLVAGWKTMLLHQLITGHSYLCNLLEKNPTGYGLASSNTPPAKALYSFNLIVWLIE